MEKFNRGVRRHHVARLKEYRSKYYGYYGEKNPPRNIGMLVHTAKLCSCYMCCNCRKINGRTLQELRGIDLMEDQLSESVIQDCEHS